MKSYRIWLVSFGAALLIVCSAFSAAYSQDLSGWVGQWFKLTYSYKGYETVSDPAHTPQSQTGKTTSYVKITSWNTANQSDKFLTCAQYEQDEEGVINENITLHFLGGTDLDFLVLCHIVSEENIGFTARITGKESAGTLKSATAKTLGGYSYTRSDDPVLSPRNGRAEGLTITGSLIPESKLPSWVPK